MLKFVLFLCFVLTRLIIARSTNECVMLFPKKNDKNQPLLLNNSTSSFKLIIPNEGRISLKLGESIQLLCSPGKNKLIRSNQQLTTVTCGHGSTFEISGIQYDFDELQCTSPIKAEVLQTKSNCAKNRGKILNIGFKPSTNDWLQLIQVCYDEDTGNTLYAEHILNGDAINFASTQSARPGFQTTGLLPDISPNNNYKQVNQKAQFIRLLGSSATADEYLNTKSYLVRGHLAPDADFIFAGLQFSTYFYINTCPQWDAINSGNWLSIEHTVRKVAERYHTPLRIITGSHGILTLLDDNNQLQNIYLSPNGKLPVPKFVWKVIYSESTKEGIALVILNDPFIERLSADELLCEDLCSEYGWFSKRWSNNKKGYAYCCDVRKLRKVIDTIPNLSIRGILRA